MEHMKLQVATAEEKEVLTNLFQLYDYDFSEYLDFDVNDKGRFEPYTYLDDYWIDKGRFPYLIKLKDHIAGFALVRIIREEERIYHSIAEFFVLRKYRRSGIGKEIAKRLFAMHKGEWEVYQVENNRSAQSFWLNVINEYTRGIFHTREDNGRTIQTFVS